MVQLEFTGNSNWVEMNVINSQREDQAVKFNFSFYQTEINISDFQKCPFVLNFLTFSSKNDPLLVFGMFFQKPLVCFLKK